MKTSPTPLPVLTQVQYALCRTSSYPDVPSTIAGLISSFLDVSMLFTPTHAAASGSVRLFQRVVTYSLNHTVNPILRDEGYSQALEAAIKSNDLVIVKVIHGLCPEALKVRSLELALAHGSFELVQWIVANRQDDVCCTTGLTNLCSECVKMATQSFGNKDAFRIGKWLMENQLILIRDSSGSDRVQSVILHITGGLSNAARRVLLQSAEMVQWCHEQGLLTELMMDRLVLESLEWIKPASIGIVKYAVEHGYTPQHAGRYVDVLIKVSRRRDQEALVKIALKAIPDQLRHHFTYAPIRPGGTNVLQWSSAYEQERGRDMAVARIYAQYSDDIDNLVWYFEKRQPVMTSSILTTRSEDDAIEILSWLHSRDNGTIPFSATLMDVAAGEGYLRVVQWLAKHRNEGCTVNAMDKAAQGGHLEIIQWLHENRREGCTSRAILRAAQEGHLHVVQWLYEHRTEGNITKTMACAAVSGYLEIVRWCLDCGACGQCVYTQLLERPTMFAGLNRTYPHPRLLYCLHWLRNHNERTAIACQGECARLEEQFPSGNLATKALAVGDHLLLEYLYEYHRDLFTTDEEVGGVAKFAIGHPTTMRWLFERFPSSFDWLHVAEHAERVQQTVVGRLVREMVAQHGLATTNSNEHE